MEVVDRSRRSRSRKRRVSNHDLGLREMGEVREVDDSLPVSFADKPSGAAKARNLGSLRSVVQLQWWMSDWRMRNHIAPHHNMKVFGVILTGLLLSIWGWAYIAPHGNVVRTLGMSTMEWSSPFSDGCFNGVCMEDKINNPSWPMPMSSEGTSNDPILEPKHKIFLSHSGVQKEFVEHLCKALEDRFHYPFFDRRHESLPKGERFPELIVQAARQCEMLIVVVSKEYFMSKWPMIELSTFVNAHKLHLESKSSTKGPKILPLFYGLSVSDLDNEMLRKKWFEEWKTLAKADPRKRIIVHDWKYALDILRSFNGLPYDKNLKEIVAYEEKIVSYVCKSIAPDVRWDDFHVQGKSNILKVIGEKIEGVGVSTQYKVKVVGIYGVGGIGKTTTCKTLCNELSIKYEGRVCHIELPIVPSSISKEIFQKVLRDLTRKSVDDIQHLEEGQCKDILRKSLFKQKTFLAIDNILDNHQSIQLTKTFLELPYHPDSLVVVTARSQSVLKLLDLDEDAYIEMPDLGEVDAMRLFLHQAASGKEFFKDEEKRNIMTCVRRCYFSKGDGQGHHYHPLALQALGLQLGFHGKNPSMWVKNLPQVRTFNYFSGGNPVFDIMRSSFDLLSPRDQTFFMDVGYFSSWAPCTGGFNIEWVRDLYAQDKEEIMHKLERLKQKGLLVDVDLRTGRISMHDLYREFARLEAKGSLKLSLEMVERKWLYMRDDFTELKSKPKGGYWHKMIRLTIKYLCGAPEKHGQIIGGIESLEGLKWDYFSNLEVLQLYGLDCKHGASLNLEGLIRLRILELVDVIYMDRIEGLEKLKHLGRFIWRVTSFESTSCRPNSSHNKGTHVVGQLPLSLYHLHIFDPGLVLRSDLLARYHHLYKLELHWIEVRLLDLSNCSSLEMVTLSRIQKLQSLSGLATHLSPNLQSLKVWNCTDLVDIPGIDHLINLEELHIEGCPKFEVPSLLALTKLRVLELPKHERLLVHVQDYIPPQLVELHLCLSQSSMELNLNGFNQLRVLSLRWSDGLTSLARLGDLPALEHLDLHDCKHLLRLPDLSKSKNLEEINLEGCSALELHEKDIQMLSKLLELQPVHFSGMDELGKIKLDLVRRKVLIHSSTLPPPSGKPWKASEWEEQDLGTPPIKIRKWGTWESDLVGTDDLDTN